MDATLAKNLEWYKMWFSKQHTGFSGTGLQVSYHRGLKRKQAECPNCGRTESSAHLYLCPSQGRTNLLIDATREPETWMNKDERTEPKLAYWIPKYILMRGTRTFLDVGLTPP